MRAMFWESLPDGDVQCHLCEHSCKIKKGNKGKCSVRVNIGGSLQSLVSNVVTSGQVDPIEKKPLYHFFPGVKTFSIGSAGCNFRCSFCQNHRISCVPENGVIPGRRATPDALIGLVEQNHNRIVAFTYNEPTVFFEQIYEASGLAKARNMKVVLVSNGFMSDGFLQSLYKRVDAINVDLKAFSEKFYRERCGGRLKPVLKNLKTIKSMGWWLEVTTLVIPGCNDSESELRDLAAFIYQELGPDTPWHITAFHGAYKMIDHPSTPSEQLEKIWSYGRESGLNYVYVGNIPCNVGSHTFCPTCSAMVIERNGYHIKYTGPIGQCPSCQVVLPGVWR